MTIHEHAMMIVLNEVAEERERQDAKWGEQNHDPAIWLAILAEEFGEIGKEVLEPEPTDNYRRELVQLAAVAVAAIESFDRARLAGKS